MSASVSSFEIQIKYIFVKLHATDFVSGHGRVAPQFVPKGARVRIYEFMLAGIALIPDAQLFNAVAPIGAEERLFGFLLNRININMHKSGSIALLFSDEGKSYDSMLRRMRRFNYIPSKYGTWAGGDAARNIPIDRIIEDISYRDSKRSLFVQAADFCAYALLRCERPIPAKTKYGLDRSFLILEPIMVKAANGRDRYGVIRA